MAHQCAMAHWLKIIALAFLNQNKTGLSLPFLFQFRLRPEALVSEHHPCHSAE